MAEFVEFNGTLDEFLTVMGFKETPSGTQQRMEEGHAMAEDALRGDTEHIMDMIPRITIRDEDDLIHLTAAMMCAKESMVGTVSKAIAEYGLKGTPEAYQKLQEVTAALGRVVGLAFNLQEMYDDLVARTRVRMNFDSQ